MRALIALLSALLFAAAPAHAAPIAQRAAATPSAPRGETPPVTPSETPSELRQPLAYASLGAPFVSYSDFRQARNNPF